MSDKPIENAEHWRERADEVRAQAAGVRDAVSRRVLLAIADGYEMMAKRAEQKAQGG